MSEQRAEIRDTNSRYYGGDLLLLSDPEEFDPARLEWIAYAGGGCTIQFSWDEIERLHEATGSLLAAKPEWAE